MKEIWNNFPNTLKYFFTIVFTTLIVGGALNVDNLKKIEETEKLVEETNEEIKVSIIVRNERNKKSISNVKVKLDYVGAPTVEFTDSEGYVYTKIPKTDTIRIYLSKEGFEDRIIQLDPEINVPSDRNISYYLVPNDSSKNNLEGKNTSRDSKTKEEIQFNKSLQVAIGKANNKKYRQAIDIVKKIPPSASVYDKALSMIQDWKEKMGLEGSADGLYIYQDKDKSNELLLLKKQGNYIIGQQFAYQTSHVLCLKGILQNNIINNVKVGAESYDDQEGYVEKSDNVNLSRWQRLSLNDVYNSDRGVRDAEEIISNCQHIFLTPFNLQ